MTMQDQDIHAFTPPPSAAPAAPAKRVRRRWPWVLGGLLLLSLVLVMTALTLLGLLDGVRDGLNVVVDGESWHVFTPQGLGGGVGSGVGSAVGVSVALLVMLVVVMLVVPLALTGVLLVVVVAVGLAVLAAALGLAVGLASVLLVLALGLSPLWGVVLLLWLLLRPSRKTAAV
jgi:hypothetical protein